MPTRKTPLVNEQYYHIYNRGVARLPTFSAKRDYERFITSLLYYRFNSPPFKLSRLLNFPKEQQEKILGKITEINDTKVEIISFCLMPNHFHLLLRQNIENGISIFLKHLTDSYTRYYNTKHKRVGPLFQGAFKAVHIESTEQLLHLSRYIHLNPLVSYVVTEKRFLDYPWSSLNVFLNGTSSFVNPKIILEHFRSPKEYF